MALRFPQPVYTDLDQDQLFERLRELVLSVYPTLDLDNKADLVRLILEGEAFTGDIITDLMRRKGRNSRMITAEDYSAILEHARFFGYRPFSARAARVTETFTLTSGAPAASVTFPKGTIVRTPEQAEPVRFQLLADLVLAPGQTTATAIVEHSIFQTEGIDSTGKTFQRYTLSNTPYLDASVIITTTQGTWTEVPHFVDSQAGDLHYTTTIDAKGRCSIAFGDGVNGAVPDGTITFEYKTGGGLAGRLDPGALNVIDGSFSDANGNEVTVSVTNLLRTEGAEDRQSGPLIKILATASVQVPANTVGRSDYETVAMSRPGVARALHLTRNQDIAVNHNEGFLFIVGRGADVVTPAGRVVGVKAALPTQLVLDDVAAQMADEVAIAGILPAQPKGPRPKTTTFQLRVRPAVFKTVDVFARIYIRQGFGEATVRTNILYALDEYFAPLLEAERARQIDPELVTERARGLIPNPRINFGYSLQDQDGIPTEVLARSDLFDAVRDAPGVLKIGPSTADFLLNGTSTVDPPIMRREFPAPGTITLINAKTGLPF